jgi:hypothetical protein
MSIIDRQRIEAVRFLEAHGYRFSPTDGWTGGQLPASVAILDAMHGALMRRADALEGCTEGSDEDAELEDIVNMIGTYEALRWPAGKVTGGKG